jgi:hypothetical protein
VAVDAAEDLAEVGGQGVGGGDPTWLKLVRTRVAVDAAEDLAEVGGQGVGGGDPTWLKLVRKLRSAGLGYHTRRGSPAGN